MAYVIVKSDGSTLTTIADGTINTTSTSLGLPGRNYAGYGQSLDDNFVHITENFASTTPPANPLRGQLWYNTNNQTLYVCPTDGESNANAWLSLTSTSSGGSTTFGNVNINGNATANNGTFTNDCNANAVTSSFLTVISNTTLGNATIANANIVTLTTTELTTGAAATAGNLTGTWTVTGTGNLNGNALVLNQGGIYINPTGNLYGIRTDKYMWANGVAVDFAGTYSNSNVALYLPTFNGNILTNRTQAATLTTGSSATAGNITGNWSLTSGSRLNATYADLAERFEADAVYVPGTVVEIGGEKEITAVKIELSENVFGVISNTAAYLMNAMAGDDETHPAVAMTGRVRVRATGAITKGDRLVSAGEGLARAAKAGEATAFNTIGRALQNKVDTDEGFIEAIVMIK